jgi:hypothetical protein
MDLPPFELGPGAGAPFESLNEMTTQYIEELPPDLNELTTQGHPYMSVIQNVSTKHFADIKAGIPRSITNNHSARNRLRDFLNMYNETLVQSFVSRGQLSPTLSLAEHVFRKFGKGAQIQGPLKELNLDSTLKESMAEVDKEIQWVAPTPSFGPQATQATQAIPGQPESDPQLPAVSETEKLIWRLRRIMELYRNTALALMKAEETLKTRCENLEKLSAHLLLVTGLPESESYAELLQANQKYLEDIFQKTKVKEAYDDMIKLYKKWLICREVITASVPSTAVNGAPLCSICLNEGVTHAMAPCGHTFCQTCTASRQPVSCYVCRKVITQMIKLYFT